LSHDAIQVELCGATRTVADMRLDAIGMLGVDLVVDQAVQENFSFVAVHLRFPSAASHAATFLTQSRSGRPAGRPLVDIGPGCAQRRHCPANALRAATRIDAGARNPPLRPTLAVAASIRTPIRIPTCRSGRPALYSRAALKPSYRGSNANLVELRRPIERCEE
jgi:hypothetical protein